MAAFKFILLKIKDYIGLEKAYRTFSKSIPNVLKFDREQILKRSGSINILYYKQIEHHDE